MHLTFIPFISLFSEFDFPPELTEFLYLRKLTQKRIWVDIFALKSYIQFGDPTVFSVCVCVGGGDSRSVRESDVAGCAPLTTDTLLWWGGGPRGRAGGEDTDGPCFITAWSRNHKKPSFPSSVSIYSLFSTRKNARSSCLFSYPAIGICQTW